MTTISEYYPLSFDAINISEPDLESWLHARYQRHKCNHTRLNLISTLNGAFKGEDGTSETITGGADREILKHIRRISDVVLVGAKTIREENYRSPSNTRIATITQTGNLKGHRLSQHQAPILVFCSKNNALKITKNLGSVNYELIPLAAEQPDALLRSAIAELHRRSLTQIVCEGGPALAKQMLRYRLIDELCLSITSENSAEAPAQNHLPINPKAQLLGALADTAGINYLRFSNVS